MKTKCLLSTSSTIKFQAHPSRRLSKSRICPSSPQICQILWNASWRKSRCSKTYSMRSLLYIDLSSSNSKKLSVCSWSTNLRRERLSRGNRWPPLHVSLLFKPNTSSTGKPINFMDYFRRRTIFVRTIP